MDKEDLEFIEKQKEVVISTYEQAKSYANIIIFGGYAGLFAVWNFTKNELERWQTLSVGLLAIVSLLIFIIFELYGAWLRGTDVKRLMLELQEAERLDRLPTEYRKTGRQRAEKFLKLWPYFFFSSAGTALAAALILVYSFVIGLLCG